MIAIPMSFAALAVLSWLGAAVHALLLVRHRRDDVSVAQLMFQGHRFFSRDSWKPEGHAIQRRFLLFGLAFFLCVVAGALSGVLVGQIAPHGRHR